MFIILQLPFFYLRLTNIVIRLGEVFFADLLARRSKNLTFNKIFTIQQYMVIEFFLMYIEYLLNLRLEVFIDQNQKIFISMYKVADGETLICSYKRKIELLIFVFRFKLNLLNHWRMINYKMFFFVVKLTNVLINIDQMV